MNIVKSIYSFLELKKSLLFLTLLLLSLIVNIQAQNNIEVYNTYGNEEQVFIQGRMLVKKEFQEVQKDDNWFLNLWRRAREIQSNEIEEATIIATIKSQFYETRGDDEGYFDFNIKSTLFLSTGYEPIDLKIKNNSTSYRTQATIINSQQKLLGIICDIDDTVMISNVPNKFKFSMNTLLKNYKQRKVVPTMAKRLQKLLSENPKEAPSTLFFLSGSPQQLFNPIESFLAYNHFPKHTIILKKVHGDHTDPLTDQLAYKSQKIEQLIRLYPNIQWVMFGDSGEKDKEVYELMKKRYPNKIRKFYIRDVDTGDIKEYPIKRQKP
ncbi:MAG TPA: DUF2183 domain-containing protein [Campylobacterales bacterium]|nr:DUF2183 domain-containing protein [Campylobacterales bacterium]